MILWSDESKLVTLHWVFLVPRGQTVLRATGTIVHRISQDYLLFKRKHASREKNASKKKLILTICGFGGLSFIEQEFNELHKKLIQAILSPVREENNKNLLMHQQLTCKRTTNQPETQITTLNLWLQHNGALNF